MKWFKEKLLQLSMYWEIEKMKWSRAHIDEYNEAFEEVQRYCSQCSQIAFEDYMLTDNLWYAHCKDIELVHIHCFEKMIGRELTIHDFSPAPINDNIRWALSKGIKMT